MARTRTWALTITGFCWAAALAAQSVPAFKTFSLAGQISIELDTRWNQRLDAEPPPLPTLAASAPKMEFSDILILENSGEQRILQLALTNNPFIGRDARWLDENFHGPGNTGARMADHLFYFFFPPPGSCLERGEQLLARRVHEQEMNAERDKDGKLKAPLSTVTYSQPCEFSTTLRQLFAEQVSSRVSFERRHGEMRVGGEMRAFYLPPMEETQVGSRTFFVFEAQGQRLIDTAEIDKYGLPESLRGAHANFFWAIGAPTPFPFLKDPARKDVQLLHVVYACLSLDGGSRKEFFEILRAIR